ncbi:MAG: hypothetical protein H7832_07410 [Magnetococcus sp. DMHC-6]
MATIFFSLLFLSFILWFLVKLRYLRENTVKQELPNDESTILLGLFLSISRACLEYHRDRGLYPAVVSGAADGLLELGYFKEDPLAKMTSAMTLFSIIATETTGYGVCLAHTTSSMANALIERIKTTNRDLVFVEMKNGQYLPLMPPITHSDINLVLPLPPRPLPRRII